MRHVFGYMFCTRLGISLMEILGCHQMLIAMVEIVGFDGA